MLVSHFSRLLNVGCALGQDLKGELEAFYVFKLSGYINQQIVDLPLLDIHVAYQVISVEFNDWLLFLLRIVCLSALLRFWIF